MTDNSTPNKTMPSSHIKESQVSSLSPTENNCSENKLLPCLCKFPYPATKTNILWLKAFIIQQFTPTAFNTELPYLSMDTQSSHIHLKPDTTPHKTLIPISLDWKTEVKESIDADVEKEIVEPILISEPVKWCVLMVVIPQKGGRPRGAVDLLKLNA